MHSIKGKSGPSDNYISKLVSFFQLHCDKSIINNTVAAFLSISDDKCFQDFCSECNLTYKDPLMVQLRRTLTLNAPYLWHEFMDHVRTEILTFGPACKA